MEELEKKAEGGNGGAQKPETIQIVITLQNGEAILTGNISPMPVISLGLIEDAKAKLIGFYSQRKFQQQVNKKEIVRPDGSKFISGVRNLLRK